MNTVKEASFSDVRRSWRLDGQSSSSYIKNFLHRSGAVKNNRLTEEDVEAIVIATMDFYAKESINCQHKDDEIVALFTTLDIPEIYVVEMLCFISNDIARLVNNFVGNIYYDNKHKYLAVVSPHPPFDIYVHYR